MVKQTAGRDALGTFAPQFAALSDEILCKCGIWFTLSEKSAVFFGRIVWQPQRKTVSASQKWWKF